MEIVKTKFDGFCKGVSRAVTTALDSGVGTYVLGNLVHNEIVMKTISDRGLVTVGSDDEIPSGAKVIIRAHGGKIKTKELRDNRLHVSFRKENTRHRFGVFFKRFSYYRFR